MILVRFLHDYRVRVETTCCYSGHVSTSYGWPYHLRTPIARWTLAEAQNVRPSTRRTTCGRKTFLCPQFVDIDLNDGLHPTRLIEVPRDMLCIYYDVSQAAGDVAMLVGIDPRAAQDWLTTGFARKLSPMLRITSDHLDRAVHA